MAADKRKILEAARKHAQKGAQEKALKEYDKLLKLDPRDAKLRLEIGDARQRWGQVAEAIEAYSSVAEQFMRDGFDARAVAVFKQIQNLDPNELSTYEPLSELYQRMGLSAEAISCLQTAADTYHKAGQKQEALGLLRKMAQIDPSNTVSRLKVADLLHQEGMNEEALSEFDEIAGELEAQSDSEGAAKVYERILEIVPDRTTTLARYARNLIDRGTGERAEALAKRALDVEPSPEHYELLADVYRLDKRDADLVNLYRDLAEVYRQRGDEERGREILQRYVPLDDLSTSAEIDVEGEDLPASSVRLDELNLGDETTLLDQDLLTDDSLLVTDGDSRLGIGSPTSGPALDAPGVESDSNEQTRALTQGGQPSQLPIDLDQLMAEASVYLRYGKREQAIANLESVLETDPDHRLALERLGEAHVDAGNSALAVEVWSRAAVLAAADGEPETAQLLRSRIRALDPAASESLEVEEPVDQGAAADEAFAPDSKPSLEEIELEEVAFEEVEGASPPSGALDLDPGGFDELQLDPASPEDDDLEEIELTDIEIDIDAASFIGDTPEPQTSTEEPAPSSESTGEGPSPQQIADDLEEADFYLQQGLLDEAEAVYERILSIAPNHPHAMVRLGELAAQRGDDPSGAAIAPAGTAPIEEVGTPEQTDELDVGDDPASWADDASSPDDPGVDFDGPTLGVGDELDEDDSDTWSGPPDVATDEGEPAEALDESLDVELEIDVDLDLESTPEADERLAADGFDATEPGSSTTDSPFESEPEADPDTAPQFAVTEVDLCDEEEPEGVEGPTGFDLAAELSQVFGEEAAPETVGFSPGDSADTSDDGFAAVFAEFKKGVTEALSDGDYQAHYDLGIAYREMGLFDDAIGEFRNAMGDPARTVGCLHLMGLCALDHGQPEQAVCHLQEALAAESVSGETELALQLDLGRSFEASGDCEQARNSYERVHGVDPSFGDVASRLEALGEAKQEAASSAEDTDQYESFDDFLEEVEADERASSSADSSGTVEPDTEPDPAEPESPSWESFEDVVAETGELAESADAGGREPRAVEAVDVGVAAEDAAADAEGPEIEIVTAEVEDAEAIDASEVIAPDPIAESAEPVPSTPKKKKKISFV